MPLADCLRDVSSAVYASKPMEAGSTLGGNGWAAETNQSKLFSEGEQL